MRVYVIEQANQYLAVGLSVLPAKRQEKRPCIGAWKQYQQRLPMLPEVDAWFSNLHDGICIITGAVSGNLEIIDFDNGGELFDAWYQLIDADLRNQLIIEQTPSGGWHVMYRCEAPISGNMKLAQRKDGNKVHTLIETRGEGGLFLCAPTAGYELMQGDFSQIPVLTQSQRDFLLTTAWSLNEYIPEPAPMPTGSDSSSLRPGDDYNARGNVAELLQSHGWQIAHTAGENQRWRRPGKDTGWSATLRTTDNVFYVFSSNAAPFEGDTPYSPFMTYTLLEHNGDFSKAALELSKHGYGEKQEPEDTNVDISAIIDQSDLDEPEHTVAHDPGEFPRHLLSVPGFINDVCDFMLQTAPHPEPILSFFGALCLQSVLAGRKVRDAQDNRTNLYILNLAYPGCGKDHPRKVNSEILKAVGITNGTADGFASGEAIEDKMLISPATLFQTDEIDTIITAMSGGRDSRIEMITHVLLKMFSAANALYLARLKAGQKETPAIDQPSLTIYGTAVPENYYQALSNKMLTNGFFARMLVFEAGARTPEQDFTTSPIPDSIIRAAKHWAGFFPGGGNLSNYHPVPLVVEHTPEAKDLQRAYGRKADEKYDQAQEIADLVTMAMWGRASEKARRLALIYACSENAVRPQITPQAVQWASEMVDYATSRMLFMSSQYVSESEFHANCQKLLRVLREWKAKKGSAWMPFWLVNRKLPWSQRDHEDVRATLINQQRIEYHEETTKGSPKRLYRVAE